MHNPFHTPFSSSDLCITQEDYDSIFKHNLTSDCKKELEIVSYNTFAFGVATALTPGRFEQSVDLIANLDADVICLQEIFEPQEIDYATERLETAGWEVYVDYQ